MDMLFCKGGFITYDFSQWQRIFLVKGADWEYRNSGGRGSGGAATPDTEAVAAFMWLKVTKINI